MELFSRRVALLFPLALCVGADPAQCFAADYQQLERCLIGASQHYQVDPSLIKAIVRQEGGVVGKVTWNKNGSYDIGPMQVNSSHLAELARYGITGQMLQFDGCLNIYIGAWMLKREIVATADLWRAIGNYHSHSASLNADYQWRIWHRLQQIRAGR